MAEREKMDEDRLKSLVASEIAAAIDFDASELSKKRANALEYYQGEMKDLPAMKGRSSVTSRDLSDTIGWMLPGIIRVFTASDQFGIYEPQRPGDEETANQATDYANYVFWKDCDGYRVLYNITHDSLLHGNGIGKIWWDDTEETETSNHTRLSAEQIAMLTEDEDVEILSQSKNDDADLVPQPDPENGEITMVPLETWDVKVKRVTSRGRIKVAAIPPEDFLMDKDATTIDEARFVAHRELKTRSELIEMGFSKDKVDDLPSESTEDWAEESLARDDDRIDWQGSVDRSEETVELFECCIKADVDGDGVSETLRVYYAGNQGSGELLKKADGEGTKTSAKALMFEDGKPKGSMMHWEVVEDDHPFFDCPCEPVPHRWDARSIADDTTDVQQVKTALIRGVLDNLYASNLPMPVVEEKTIKNMDQLLNPQFGVPIITTKGAVVNWQEVPFVAGESLKGIEFFDQVIEKRTGVSRTTMALDPEALQNQTATANQNAKDAAYSQVELIARNHAELGWANMYRKMLRLIVKHQDRPRTIRLRDEWVEMDPAHWNANMDVTINVGLGTGSRDRDMQMLAHVQMNQKALIDYAAAAGMPELAIEMLPKALHSMRKMAESAGIRDVDSFYPEVKPEQLKQIQENMKAKQAQGDPKVAMEAEKMKADMQMQQQKMQADQQAKQAELQMKQQQMKMDAQIKAQQIQADADLKRQQIEMEMALKREQLVAELQLKRDQMAEEMKLKREMGMADGFAKVTTALSSDVRPGGEPG